MDLEQKKEELKALLDVLAKALVEEPEKVRIDVVDNDGLLVLELRVADKDMGRVIGKGGRRAQAIRSIMKAKASRIDCRVAVDIVD